MLAPPAGCSTLQPPSDRYSPFKSTRVQKQTEIIILIIIKSKAPQVRLVKTNDKKNKKNAVQMFHFKTFS